MPFIDLFQEAYAIYEVYIANFLSGDALAYAMELAPFIAMFELPLYLLIFLGVFKFYRRKAMTKPAMLTFSPSVTCIVTCYSEGKDVQTTISSMANQIYPGHIEVLAMIDGAVANKPTYDAAQEMLPKVRRIANRSLRVIPKWLRGGRVSSENTGLAIASGEIIMVLDGDTSFDNDMVANAVQHFQDPNVAAVSGNLRLRNVKDGLAAKLQAIEYMMSIGTSKVGLSEFNIVNNVSGAFGIFRKSVMQHIGGWDSGTAEDLDLTLRLKKYFARYPKMRIVFEYYALGHTDGPGTFKEFFKQRHRWDGDLFYLYILKHGQSLKPGLLGWRNFIALVWMGLFFQLVMPFIIVSYTLFLLVTAPLASTMAVLLLVYVFYFVMSMAMYLVGVFLLSDRKKEDLKLIWCLPFIPIFTFATRCWSAFASVDEIIRHIHLDSSMAPWWVLKRAKF